MKEPSKQGSIYKVSKAIEEELGKLGVAVSAKDYHGDEGVKSDEDGEFCG